LNLDIDDDSGHADNDGTKLFTSPCCNKKGSLERRAWVENDMLNSNKLRLMKTFLFFVL
jgi:hypothetical protein